MRMKIKKKQQIILLMLLLIILPVNTQAATTMWTTANLRARTAPSLKAEIYDVLPKGSKVKCTKKGKKWNTVIIDKKTYYMCNDYLSDTQVEPDTWDPIYSAGYFKKMGMIDWNGWTWTWYSENVLPGGGLDIPGRHVSDNGYIMDENGRICLASSVLEYGTILDTPFGAEGCIYDSGCADDIIDTYVSW